MFDVTLSPRVSGQNGVIPGDANAHYKLASAHLRQGEHEAALAGFCEVLRLQPDHVEALTNVDGI